MHPIPFLLLAIVIGALNAVVLYVFEFVGIEGTAWLWNDILQTDTYRWLVIPVAIALGLLLTATFKLVRMQRIVETDGDLMEELNHAPSTLKAIGAVLLVGAMSLLAGASLGPEASLMAFSAGVGTLLAARSTALKGQKQILVFTSLSGLLVAFFHSAILIVAPLLMLYKAQQKINRGLPVFGLVAITLAGLSSYVAIEVIRQLGGSHTSPMLSQLPNYQWQDFFIALLVGLVVAFVALGLRHAIHHFSRISLKIIQHRHRSIDWIFAAIAGLVLGIIYLIGGTSVQFSGSIGSHELLAQSAQLSVGALIVMGMMKLLATAWSSSTGYRGGLVFPSIYIGLVIGLVLGQLLPEYAGAGMLVGAVAGIITAVIGSPVLASIFLVAVIPLASWPVALFAVLGVLVFGFIRRAVLTNKNPSK